jgi:hypothetical protein
MQSVDVEQRQKVWEILPDKYKLFLLKTDDDQWQTWNTTIINTGTRIRSKIYYSIYTNLYNEKS